MEWPSIVISRRWRLPRVLIGLFVVEFMLTIACLTLFGIADPNTYRIKLWQNGADHFFNSAPIIINLNPGLKTPIPWSSYLTQFNIIASVLSMFILLAKVTMYIMHAWIPLLSVIIHGILIALYAISLRNQSAPDLADPQHPNHGLPWMLSKGCSYASPQNYGYCMQARAAFGVTCTMVALFSVYFLFSAWNVFPTKEERTERLADRKARKELEIELKQFSDNPDGPELSQEEKWQRNREVFLNLPKTPNTPGFGGMNPMTPRTTAFAKLNGGKIDGGLPFRQQYGADAISRA